MNMVVHPGMMTERLFMTNTDNYIIGKDGPGECIHKTPKKTSLRHSVPSRSESCVNVSPCCPYGG